MALLIGTDDGLYRVGRIPFESDDVVDVLDVGRVSSVRRFPHCSDVYAASEAGLFRSSDGGRSWTDLDVPSDNQLWSVSDGSDERIYAGTDDPALYRSPDGGSTWQRLAGIDALPSRERWRSPVDPDRARVRTIATPPTGSARLLVGIESGGVHWSDDGGETWEDGRETLQDDVHHVDALSDDVYLAATGFLDLDLESTEFGHAQGMGGVYRTTDAGESWTRLDAGNDHSYVRELFAHDGTLYFCGSTRPPPEWQEYGADARLFESTNLGRTMDRVSYPGMPRELIEAWTAADGRVIAGTSRHVSSLPDGNRGRILRRADDGEYHTIGTVPASVTSLEAI